MSPDEARRAALREFQRFDQRKEECRDARGFNLLDNLAQDVRFTLRQLAKNPGFTSTAILMLALGLCASVAIFAFVDAALIRPLPYRNPSRLVALYERNPAFPRCNLSYLDYLDWRKLNKSFVKLEAFHDAGFIVTTPSGAEQADGARVSDGFFRALGVTPVVGRDFFAGEDLPGAALTVMLSHAAWEKRYGAKLEVVGQSVILDGDPYIIIGVLPADFHFAPVRRAEYWAMLDANAWCEKHRTCHNLFGVARLKDGVSVEAALADTKAIAQLLERQYPDSNRGQGANVVPLTEVITGDIRPILLVLLGGAGLLLVIACVNISSLLLVRSESRRREMAVRSALGASRARLICQFVAEGLVLVVGGSALGLLMAESAMRLLTGLIPAGMQAQLPFLTDLGLNVRVAGFACAISLLAAVLFTATPMLRLSFGEMREGLMEASRGSAGTTWRRVGSKLVMLELATAMVLLVGAGLLGQSLYRLLHVNLGFQPDRLATLRISAPDASYGKDPQAVALARRIMDRVSSLPGVRSVSTISTLPVSFNGNTVWFRVVGHPYHGEHNEVNQRTVSAGYFLTIRARLSRGRYFNDGDDLKHPRVAIINQALAKKYFPGEDPLGKQIAYHDLAPDSISQVVGIVEDVRDGPLDEEIWPTIYRPFNQEPDTEFSLIARTSQPEGSLLLSMAAVVREIDRGIVTADPISMPSRIENSTSAYLHRSSAWLVGGFATLALLLAVVGLYGVVAYSVSQRTREIGVRMALGAEPREVHEMVLREAGRLAAIGILAGLVGALAATTLLGKLLFGVRSWDVPTLVGVALILAICALIASYIPAHRAAAVNPVEALRAE